MENPTLRWVFLFDKTEHFLPDFPLIFPYFFLDKYIYILFILFNLFREQKTLEPLRLLGFLL